MKAMILAAGRGKRMRPLTATLPKPLLEVGGKPLIVWHIEKLVDAGITQIILNHAWQGHLIEQALGCGNTWGPLYIIPPSPTGWKPLGALPKPFLFLTNNRFSSSMAIFGVIGMSSRRNSVPVPLNKRPR